jgi:hypothetical protein
VEEILREVQPVSIYLAGSFGRDEGSLRLSKGLLSPMRDYDVLIVTDKRIDGDIIKLIRKRIHEKIGLPDPYSRKYKFSGFTVWITQTPLKDIDVLPLLKIFELRESSQLLWGSDVRSRIHLTLEDLSSYNGVLILFSKVDGLLGLLDIDGLRMRDMTKRADFFYECMKTYSEMGTVLNLLHKSYATSFVRRSLRLSEDFSKLHPELRQINSLLPSLVTASAYKRLLIDDESLLNIDFGGLLVETLDDLKLVLWYYLRKAYNVDIPLSSKYAHMFDAWVEKLDTKLLTSLLGFYLKRKLGLSSRLLKELAIRAYVRYTLLMFFIKGRKNGYPIKPRILLVRNGNIMLRLWLIGFILLEGVAANLSIDEAAIDEAEKRISEILDLRTIQKSFSAKTAEAKFSVLKKVYLGLLDLGDRLFHRKD